VAQAPGQITVEEGEGVSVVRVLGEHDLSTRGPLADELERVSGRGGRVVVDLSEAEFIDSTILGVLIGGHRQVTAAAGSYALVAPSGGRPRRLLEMTRVADRIPVFETRADAVAAQG
jgi:anti-sigma B factor antagonist